MTHIEEQMGRLFNAEEQLNRVICELESKLSQILVHEKDCEPKPSPQEPWVVPLAEKIRNVCDSIGSQAMRVENIIRRIEL